MGFHKPIPFGISCALRAIDSRAKVKLRVWCFLRNSTLSPRNCLQNLHRALGLKVTGRRACGIPSEPGRVGMRIVARQPITAYIETSSVLFSELRPKRQRGKRLPCCVGVPLGFWRRRNLRIGLRGSNNTIPMGLRRRRRFGGWCLRCDWRDARQQQPDQNDQARNRHKTLLLREL